MKFTRSSPLGNDVAFRFERGPKAAGLSAGDSGRTPDDWCNNEIDRIAFFDAKGKIARLENDSNNDGLMDRFQYYKDEILVRLERDTDFDQQIDCLDYFKDQKRIRQKKINESKKVYQITLFDEKEQPLLIKKDTSDSGSFDTIYYLNILD